MHTAGEIFVVLLFAVLLSTYSIAFGLDVMFGELMCFLLDNKIDCRIIVDNCLVFTLNISFCVNKIVCKHQEPIC